MTLEIDKLSKLHPPQDLSAERALLGAILINNRVIDQASRLQPVDFAEPMHGAAFAGMKQLWEAGREINLVTLRPLLSQTLGPQSDGAMMGFLRDLLGVGAISDIDSIERQLIDYAARRRLCEMAEDLNVTARRLTTDIREAASLTVEGIDDVLSMVATRQGTRKAIGDAMTETLQSLEQDDSANRITTGFANLDAIVGGWRRKQFAIIAGRPSMGKTSLATSAMIRTAKAGHGVMMFSLEMSTEDLTTRILTDVAYSSDHRITYADAMARRLPERDLDRLQRAAERCAGLDISIDDQRGIGLAEIGARIRAHKQRLERDGKTLDVVIIDHLGLIRPSGRYAGNKVNEVGEISDGLATLAKENDIAMVALQQLNRGTEARENKRPTLADLRNSGDLEQDADIVCFTFRQAYYLERMSFDPGTMQEQQRQQELAQCANMMEVLVAKNRNGPTTTVHLFCDMGSNAIRDLARN